MVAQTITDNHVSKLALCSSCAAELHDEHALDALHKILEGFTPRARPHSPRCPACRTSFAEFRQKGLFGCPECYDNFTAAVRDLLPRVHAGAYQHRGKTPGRR